MWKPDKIGQRTPPSPLTMSKGPGATRGAVVVMTADMDVVESSKAQKDALSNLCPDRRVGDIHLLTVGSPAVNRSYSSRASSSITTGPLPELCRSFPSFLTP